MKRDFISCAIAVVAAVVLSFFAAYKLKPYSTLTLGILLLFIFTTFVPINSDTMRYIISVYLLAFIWIFGYVIFKAVTDVKC